VAPHCRLAFTDLGIDVKTDVRRSANLAGRSTLVPACITGRAWRPGCLPPFFDDAKPRPGYLWLGIPRVRRIAATIRAIIVERRDTVSNPIVVIPVVPAARPSTTVRTRSAAVVAAPTVTVRVAPAVIMPL
jgi:hypothetical protein